ncbi:2'-5' RNA ligase family protein [Pseudonocardia acidicola]|uniref:2'-5' RNA ligase family protein n=1 Tax=Pseudonocardia acidicola TaxID=2724939 RepID=UPI00308468FB
MLPVPAADPLLTAVAAQYPDTVREGLPAHLTVLYPFVPADELDASVIEACARIVDGLAPLPVRFARCRARPGLIYLAPEPPDQVQRLLEAVWARWPDIPPYGGKYADASAHVSIALGPQEADRDAIVRLVEPLLPIKSRLAELQVAVLGEGGWAIRSRLPFGGR